MESEESTRQKKVSRLIQKEIAEIFLHKGREYAPGKLLSVTKVRISPDLSFAKVYVSIYGTNYSNQVFERLERNAGFIRKNLAGMLKARVIPDIVFVRDDSMEYGEKMDKLIDSLNK